jgi:hypothetical protein
MADLYSGWVTTRQHVARYWPSCPFDPADTEDTAELASLLLSAAEQCQAFAPQVNEDDPAFTFPESWRRAQVMQARALYRSGNAGNDSQMGAEDLTVTVWPMDRTVKALLRPRRGFPRVR